MSCAVYAASDWRYINNTTDGFKIEADLNSVINESNYGYQTNKKFWTRHTVVKDVVQDGLALGDFMMVLNIIDCNANTHGVKTFTGYKKKGKSMVQDDSYTFPTVNMKDVIPGTIGSDLISLICE